MLVFFEKYHWAKRGRASFADMPDQMLIPYDEQINTHGIGGKLGAFTP
jgi:hypothetical protein